MSEKQSSTYRNLRTYSHLGALVVLLAGAVWVGIICAPEQRSAAWLLILLLLTAFVVIAGHGVTGYWRGILIDSRHKMSLSRLQLLAWTLLILSALFTAAFSNIGFGWQSPLDIDIPSPLWVVLGISTASAVGSPAVLSSKRAQPADRLEYWTTVTELKQRGYADIDDAQCELVIRNLTPAAARWGDLLKGDETGNASVVDLGKIQMFFFTFVLIMGYGAAIAAQLGAGGPILALPEVQDGMNILLGISHTGYLTNKAMSHSRPSNVDRRSVDTDQTNPAHPQS